MTRFLIAILALATLSACSSTQDYQSSSTARASRLGEYKVGNSYSINGRTYHPNVDYDYDQTGLASWYGPGFHGKQTANGEVFDQNELTAAHKTLPMPSLVRVTNLDNGRSIVARVNDRGPFAEGRIIDLSRKGAQLLGFERKGVAKVRVSILEPESKALAEGIMKYKGKSSSTLLASQSRTPSVDPNDVPEIVVPQNAMQNVEPMNSVQVASVEQAPLEPAGTPIISNGYQPPVILGAREPIAKLPAMQKPMIKSASVAGHSNQGRFYPDVKVSQGKPQPNSQIFVQAGAFSNQENAQKLAAKLNQYGQAHISQAMVNGTNFYRVRLGPIKSASEADKILNKVMASNNKARITVE